MRGAQPIAGPIAGSDNRTSRWFHWLCAELTGVLPGLSRGRQFGAGMLLVSALLPWSMVAAVELRAGNDRYQQGISDGMLVDPTTQLALEQVRQRPDEFQAPADDIGFSDDAYWFRGHLDNIDHPDRQWLLLIEFALLDYADLYLLRQDGSIEQMQTGDRRPFSSRGVDHRLLNFLVDLPAGSSTEFYLRVATSSSVQVQLELSTLPAFQQRVYPAQIGFGLLYGTFAALLLYNLIVYFAMRDLTYIYYAIYVALFGLFQAVLNGFAFQYLWPNATGWGNQAVVTIMPLLFISMAQFSRSYMLLPIYAPKINRLFLGMMGLYVVLTICSFFLGYQQLVTVETGSSFLLMILILIGAVTVLTHGYRPALYFIVAWSSLLIGMTAYAGMTFGLFPENFYTLYGFQLGSAAELILLSFALAYRINLLREHTAQVSQVANIMLEQRVDERSGELSNALAELEQANSTLAELSQRDGLTGVFNRRHLDQTLRTVWQDAIEQQQWLALIVLDLDKFKAVNDQLGHLAGDDCLKAVADSIQRGLVDLPDATLARFGGEEFFIVLPKHSIEDARLLAEHLRQRLEHVEVRSQDHRFFVTASFGVAAIRPDPEMNWSELIQHADNAMYEAKQAGRNRVVAAAPQIIHRS